MTAVTPCSCRHSSIAFTIGAGLLAALLYSHAFDTAWVYDDIGGILQNPALRAGNSLVEIITDTPADSTPYGRPVVALSLALNYAISGLEPWSYRLLNLAAHLGSTLWLSLLLSRALSARPGLCSEQA